jgi:hypothetical protein
MTILSILNIRICLFLSSSKNIYIVKVIYNQCESFIYLDLMVKNIYIKRYFKY